MSCKVSALMQNHEFHGDFPRGILNEKHTNFLGVVIVNHDFILDMVEADLCMCPYLLSILIKSMISDRECDAELNQKSKNYSVFCVLQCFYSAFLRGSEISRFDHGKNSTFYFWHVQLSLSS